MSLENMPENWKIDFMFGMERMEDLAEEFDSHEQPLAATLGALEILIEIIVSHSPCTHEAVKAIGAAMFNSMNRSIHGGCEEDKNDPAEHS